MKEIQNSNGLVSVIVNCFNGSRFLNECIDSVLAQTYKNFEIIFWDNQSTDKSKKIIKNYSDNRIKYYYSERHTSLYEARNLALEKCTGEYVAFIDCDDIWLNDKLKLQIQEIKKNKLICLATNFFIKKNNKEKLGFKILSKYQTLNNILNNYQICFISLIVDLSFLRKNQIFFDKGYKIIGDFDFCLKILKYENIFLFNKPTCIYRIHKNNLSNTKVKIKKKEYEILSNSLKNYNFSTIEIKNFNFYVNYELFKYEVNNKNYISAISKFLFKTNLTFFFRSMIFFIICLVKRP